MRFRNEDIAETDRSQPHYFYLGLLGLVLLLGVALRIPFMAGPPLGALAWRETQTLMIARNFHRGGWNLMRPAVDFHTTEAVSADGAVGGTELQLTPFFTAALYGVTGVQDWAGRIFPLLFALTGVVFFYLLVERFHGSSCALIGALLLTVSPYHLYCGTAQMPESLAFAMAFAAIYYYDKWLSAPSASTYAVAGAAALLAVLAKPMMVMIGIPMVWLTVRQFGSSFLKRRGPWALAATVLIPAGAFAVYSNGITAETGISFAQPQLLRYSLLATTEIYTQVAWSTFRWVVTPPVLIAGVAGLWIVLRKKGSWLGPVWLAGAFTVLLLTPGGTRSNTYYHMMIAPPLIVLAGVLYTSLPAVKWARYPAALALALSVAYSAYVGIALQRPVHQTAYDCGAWINENTPEDALVLTSSPNPATLYFADRKGWTCWLQYYGEAIPFTPEVIEKVQALGASIVAIPDPYFDDDARYEPVRTWLNERFRRHVGEGFTVFYLESRANVAELP